VGGAVKVLVTRWACLSPGCHESGEGDACDRVAEKHVKAFQHGTQTWTVWEEVPNAPHPDDC
jgi:hypothetical protein